MPSTPKNLEVFQLVRKNHAICDGRLAGLVSTNNNLKYLLLIIVSVSIATDFVNFTFGGKSFLYSFIFIFLCSSLFRCYLKKIIQYQKQAKNLYVINTSY